MPNFTEVPMKQSKAIQQENPVRGELLTVSEAVKKTRKGKDWFYNHIKNKTLPFPLFPLGERKNLIDSADLDDWLASKKIPAGKSQVDIIRDVMGLGGVME